jgi:hypothetical protein
MNPYFASYNYKNSDFNSNNGSILDIVLSGGTSPYSVHWTGPSGFTSGPYTTNPSSDLINLSPGIYSGTVIDNISSSGVTKVEIKNKTKVTIGTSMVNDSCLSGGCSCEMAVTGFTHDVSKFKYDLYHLGNIVNTYTGLTGNEYHVFSGLCSYPPYNIIGYETEDIYYSYYNNTTCQTTDVNLGNTNNPDDILSGWTRVAPFAPSVLENLLTSTTIKSGLQPDGSVLSGDPTVYLYTGSTLYKGAHNITMSEGDDIGWNGGGANAASYPYCFYFNTVINKFVISLPEVGATIFHWTTIFPTENQGINGNPTAAKDMTNFGSNWSTDGFEDSYDFTISGANNTVVLASDKIQSPNNKVLQSNLNTNGFSGFISECGYINYTHEITVSSTYPDNDYLGIILCWFRDDLGNYGPPGLSHNITLSMVRNYIVQNYNVRISYNDVYQYFGATSDISSVNSFTDGHGNYNGTIIQLDGDPITGSTNPSTPITGATSSGNNWDVNGAIRIRITRSGSYGQFFKIEFTDTMGITGKIPLGSDNPYNPNYEINFDLGDSNTWVNKPSYAVGDELNKFLGTQSYGYWAMSQEHARFYDLVFSGSQSNVYPMFIDGITGLTGSETINIGDSYGSCSDVLDICSTYFTDINQFNLSIDSESIKPLDNYGLTSTTYNIFSTIIDNPCPIGNELQCGCEEISKNSLKIYIKSK